MAAAELSCQELVELVTEYLEGTLPEEDRVRFERHLDECPYCAHYVEQMRQTIATAGRIPADSVTDPAREQLLGAFRNWKRR